MSVTIAAIAGSLRAGSHTRALLRAAARNLPPGIRLVIWDGLAHVPPYSEDAEAGPAPAGVTAPIGDLAQRASAASPALAA